MYKTALNAAILFAVICVIVGAMGAHMLKSILSPALMESYDTAVKYQFYHSFALAFTGVLNMAFPGKWIKRATWMFIAGILLFSGSIYLLVALKSTADIGLGKLGLLTPIGGIFLILGWLFLLMGVNTRKK